VTTAAPTSPHHHTSTPTTSSTTHGRMAGGNIYFRNVYFYRPPARIEIMLKASYAKYRVSASNPQKQICNKQIIFRSFPGFCGLFE